MNAFTLAGADGKRASHVQPVANSVAGSPFTSAASSASTPKLTGIAILVCYLNPVHIRLDKDVGVAADTNDFLLPTETVYFMPCDGHVLSFIQASSGPGQLFVEIAREVEA